MSSFFNDKGTFTPKNNIFEKIKNNFDLEKKTNSSSDVAKSQNSQKLSSYFRQRHGLLNSNLNSSNTQVTGVAKRLFPKKDPNIYNNNNSSKDESNEFNIEYEYEKEKENLYKNPSSRNSSFISNISLTSSADIEFKDIPDLKKDVENKSTMIKPQSHIDVEKKSTPIIHNFRNLSGTKDYNKNKDTFLKSENEPIVSTNSLIHNNSFSEKNIHEIKHNSTINNDTNINVNNSGNTVPTLIDQSSNNILLDAFNSTQKICTSLKEELVSANNTITELNEENLEIKLQNEKAVESYNTIYVHYSNLFEDLTNLKQTIFNKNLENNKLKEELNLLTNDLNDIKLMVDNLNHVVKKLKHNVRQTELIIIEKDKEILKKDAKIKTLESNQMANVNNNNNMIKEIISSLQALSIQTESNISNVFKKTLNQASSTYLTAISTLISDSFGEQQNFIESNCKNLIDYNKFKATIDESIIENNSLTVENNINLIKKNLFSYIDSTTASTTDTHNAKVEASFKNINTVLNFNFENTTNTFVKKIGFVEEQLGKFLNTTNDLKKQSNFVVEKLSKIDSLEETIINLKKDIILTGEKKIENLLNNSNLSSKAMSEIQKMNQSYLPKIHNLNQSINDLKLSHNKININLDNKTVILEREFIDLKKTIKDFQNSCKPLTTRVSSTESNNNTVINDTNFTRELSGTNEFDELLSSSSDSGSQQHHQKVKESKIITNSQEFMESYDHISQESSGYHSIIRSQQGIKKKIKKVSFNNSVTILNNGSIVNLAEEFAETKKNLQNNMINELPNQNEKSKLSIFPTDTNHLNTIFSGNKFEDSLRNKNLKKKVNKKRYVDKNCEEEDNDENDGTFSDEGSSSILDAIFQNHFKGGIRKAKSSRTMANRRSNGTLMGSISSENARKEASSCNRKNKRNSVSSKK
ncbi:hypothetical protein ACO0SA_003287 [Hanseniaspora valbyensis]